MGMTLGWRDDTAMVANQFRWRSNSQANTVKLMNLYQVETKTVHSPDDNWVIKLDIGLFHFLQAQ